METTSSPTQQDLYSVHKMPPARDNFQLWEQEDKCPVLVIIPSLNPLVGLHTNSAAAQEAKKPTSIILRD